MSPIHKICLNLIEKLYRQAIKKFPEDFNLRISYISFLSKHLNKYRIAIYEI